MLTEKKKQFADNYLTCFNATEAARKAGYYSTTKGGLRKKAFMLLKDKDIKEYVESRLKEKEANDIIKADELQKFLSDCIRGTETETHHFVLRSGVKGSFDDEIIERQCPLKARDKIKAAELMAKIHKLMDSNTEQKAVKVVFDTNVPLKNKVVNHDDD